MEKFAIYSGNTLVGYSMLECGDPPMGVAFGALLPNASYSAIEHECKTNHIDQSALNLYVLSSAGVKIACAGVGILASPAEDEPPYAEVNVLGIPYPLYAELFPDHIARYEQQFSSSPSGSGTQRGGA